MPTDHALLSPSSSSRWLKCTPAAKLEAQMPAQDTSYTREGTLAHSTAEMLLNYYLQIGAAQVEDQISARYQNTDDPEASVLKAQADELGVDWYEMLDTVNDGYVKLVYEDYLAAKQEDPDALLLIEQKLKLDEYVPEGFGSSDSIIIWNRTCKVNDLKYGKGVKVDAFENTQMMLYGLGALCGPCELYDIDRIEMTIYQPRLHHVSSYEMTSQEMLTWAKGELADKASMAFEGLGAYNPGEHCHFCKAAPLCKALKAKAELTATINEVPDLLTKDQLAEALSSVDFVKAWAKSIEDYALKLALSGEKIPGYKLVEGRSLRTIKDQAGAIAALVEAGFEETDVCKPKELKTITDLEKLLRKAAFNDLLGAFVVKPQGKPTLAPESDPRAEFGGAFEDFKHIQS